MGISAEEILAEIGPVQEILDSTHPKLKGITLEGIQKVVENSDKKRFKLEERPLHYYDPNEKNKDKKIL